MGNKVKVLVLGQTPPPYLGQAIMIRLLLDIQSPDIHWVYVPMRFSEAESEIGKATGKKAILLLKLIGAVIYWRIKSGARVLYFPPAGARLVPVIRDIGLLLAVRPFFSKIVFHFHAGGLGKYLSQLPPLLRVLAKKAYGQPDATITLSELSPRDGIQISTKKNYVIPNGLPDATGEYDVSKRKANRTPELLYAGLLKEKKGVLVLLRACAILKNESIQFRLKLMGRFYSAEFESVCRGFIAGAGISENIEFLGVRSGLEKWKEFSHADIICFPTFESHETFGLIALEGMMFSLPVIASQHAGVPAVVRDGETGLLVPPRDEVSLAQGLTTLIKDPDLRAILGRNGRTRFLSEYSINRWEHAMEKVFLDL